MKKRLLCMLFPALIFCTFILGFGIKDSKGYLDYLTFEKPQMRLTESVEDSFFLGNSLVSKQAVDGFIKENGGNWKILIDKRRGVFSLIDGGAIPLIPGARSFVGWKAFGASCNSNECIGVKEVEDVARTFMADNREIFPVNQEDLVLDRDGSGPLGNSIYFLRFQWAPGGIPVEGAGVDFRFNGGNLIQVSTSKIGEFNLNTNPIISAETAMEIFSSYFGGFEASDEIIDKGSLLIVPMVPQGVEIDGYSGDIGRGISYALAFRFVFKRSGEAGTWEGLVDANNGELLRFVDMNRYGKVHGVVYPGDNHNNQQDRPFPYVATGLASPNNYSDIGGRFSGDSATLNLGQGKYTKIIDTCGGTTLTTTNGDADYGESIGQDCGVPNPNPAGAGNTYSSKVQYYHLTLINMKARSYFPANTWLNNTPITVNVNNTPTCNASSGGSYLNFYKASTGCWNLGEIPGVSLHEWGHSWDDYDGSGGGSPPLETRADWTSILQLHDSCTGRGSFLSDTCSGYGDSCTDCTGIREADYMKHSKATPWTPANNGTVYSCSSGSYNGPCGWEDHCESGIATQALWDLVARDLPSLSGMDITSSWQLIDRLSYLSMAQLGDMYNCTGSTKISDGCGGNTLYTIFRALDDDGDGTANGTPHAAAIFSALKRHNIACGNVGDAANQNQTTCPALSAPSLAAVAGNEAVTLTSSAVANASRYIFYRNEMNCDAGFTKIGTVSAPATSFVDATPVNGLTYYYRVQAAGNSDSCVSPMSACAAITPQPCTGMLILDKNMVGCTTTNVNVTLLDSTVSAPVTISIFSTSHPAPLQVTVVNESAGSASFSGSFQTTTGTPGAGQIGVAAGDTVTVRYVDPDYCGTPNRNVDVYFPVDCTPPVISNVRVSAETDTTVTVSWDTDEPANSKVFWGESKPPLEVVEDLEDYSTSHNVTVSGLDECSRYFYYVGSSDGAQNYSENTNSGDYFSMRSGIRLYLYGPDSVESGNGIWTASGTSGSTWHRDTCKANSGSYSWKAGASDSPTCSSHYGTSVVTDLTSSAIDLGSSGLDYSLNFSEWYSTEAGYDFCRVQISTNGGSSWQDLIPMYSGSSEGWKKRNVDLSAYSGSVKIRFRLTSDNYYNGLGWFVDDIDISRTEECQPVLNIVSNSLADECIGTGAGGGDGFLDAGEEAVVTIALKNVGHLTAGGVYAELSSNTSGVTVLDNYASFPDIAVGASGTSISDHFRVAAEQSIACGTEAGLTLAVHSAEKIQNIDFIQRIGKYSYSPSTLLSENFEGAKFPPTGWQQTDISGTTGNWANSSGTVHPTGGGTHSGYSLAFFNSYTATAGNSARLCTSASTAIPPNANAASVSFWMYHDTAKTALDKINVQVSTDGTAWSDIGSAVYRYDGSSGWKKHTVDVSSFIGRSIYFGFLGTSAKGNDCNIDDVVLECGVPTSCAMDTCVPSCVSPSTPSITSIIDNDANALTGLTINFTPGAPAVQHDLYMDNSLVQANFASGSTYAPGDSVQHTFKIRALNGSCFSMSNGYAATDAVASCSTPTAPSITSIIDNDACLQNGITITFTEGTPSTSNSLLMNGVESATGITSPHVFTQAGAASASYVVRTYNTSGCHSDSAASAAADAGLPVPQIGSVADSDVCALSGLTITWGAVSGATSYDLLIDSTTTLTGVATPYPYSPGDTASHSFQLRARNASCTSSWSAAIQGTDFNGISAPTITGVEDVSACAQSGITIIWGAVAGATGYDLYIDSSVTVTGVASPYLRNPGDTVSHTYQVRAKNASCTSAWSSGAAGVDLNNPASPTISGASSNVCPSGTVLLTTESGMTDYKWYAGGSLISGAATYQYAAAASGNFTVSYTNGSGCSAPSAAHAVTITPCIPNIVFQGHGMITQVTGDGDAYYDKGEKWSVQVTLTNSGNTPANNVTAVLGGNEITVCRAGNFGSIPAGGSASFTYEFVISPTFSVCGGSIGFDITGKACSELTPAGADQLDLFTITVGKQSGESSAELVIQPSTEDAYVNQTSPTGNFGTSTTMDVRARLNQATRALVKFDLSGIPAGSIVTSATLELYASAAPTVSQTLDVHRVTGTWAEGSVTWTAIPGFSGTADASISGGTAAGWKTWNVTSAVQALHAGTYTNYGFLVKCNPETGTTARTYTFSTKENATAANRPILRVVYTIPVDCSYVGSGICESCTAPAGDVVITPSAGDFTWTAGAAENYRLIRGLAANLPALKTSDPDFDCREKGLGTTTTTVSTDAPSEGNCYYYIIQGYNDTDANTSTCMGIPGYDSTGTLRIMNLVSSCP